MQGWAVDRWIRRQGRKRAALVGAYRAIEYCRGEGQLVIEVTHALYYAGTAPRPAGEARKDPQLLGQLIWLPGHILTVLDPWI